MLIKTNFDLSRILTLKPATLSGSDFFVCLKPWPWFEFGLSLSYCAIHLHPCMSWVVSSYTKPKVKHEGDSLCGEKGEDKAKIWISSSEILGYWDLVLGSDLPLQVPERKI